MMIGDDACVHCGVKTAAADRVMGSWPATSRTPPAGRLMAVHFEASDAAAEVAAGTINWRTCSMAGDEFQADRGQPQAVSGSKTPPVVIPTANTPFE